MRARKTWDWTACTCEYCGGGGNPNYCQFMDELERRMGYKEPDRFARKGKVGQYFERVFMHGVKCGHTIARCEKYDRALDALGDEG